MSYNFIEIEEKWQKYWLDNKTFKADNKSNNKVLVTQNDFSFGKASWVLPYFSKDLKHPFLYES